MVNFDLSEQPLGRSAPIPMRDLQTWNDRLFARTELLLGSEGMERLRQAHVLIVGLGGVGGYAAEMLARSGVGTLTIVDGDVVQESNTNRQLIALQQTIGTSKVTLWQERLRAINPALTLHCHTTFLRDEQTDKVVQAAPYDFAIDAIDTLSPKVHLIRALQQSGIPFISSMGAGARLDPTQVRFGRLDKVVNCKLARMTRKRLRHLGLSLKLPVIYSTELPRAEATVEVEGETNKKSLSGTIAYLPALFGCYAAYATLDHLTRNIPPV